MGLFDQLAGAVLQNVASQIQSGNLQGVIGKLLQNVNLGDVQGLVNKLQQAGLDKQVASWLGNGQNLPVSAEQLRAALGNKEVQDIARKMGLPVDQALDLLAKQLPAAVDQMSPSGKLQAMK
jgi:uncharacterized protein YidB (DUF937 family)